MEIEPKNIYYEIEKDLPTKNKLIVQKNLGELFHLFTKIYLGSLFSKNNEEISEKLKYSFRDLWSPVDNMILKKSQKLDQYKSAREELMSFSFEGEIDIIIKNVPKSSIVQLVKRRIGYVSNNLDNLTDTIDLICEVKSNAFINVKVEQWNKYVNLITFLKKYDIQEVNSYFNVNNNNSKLMTLVTNGYIFDFINLLEQKIFSEDKSGNVTENSSFQKVNSFNTNFSDPCSKNPGKLTPIIQMFKKRNFPLLIIYIPQIYLRECFQHFTGPSQKKLLFQEQIEKLIKENEEIKKENEEIKKENEKIKKENEEIKKENEEIKKENEKIKKENEEIKKENEKIKKENEEIKKENEKLIKKNEELTRRIDILFERVEALEKQKMNE